MSPRWKPLLLVGAGLGLALGALRLSSEVLSGWTAAAVTALIAFGCLFSLSFLAQRYGIDLGFKRADDAPDAGARPSNSGPARKALRDVGILAAALAPIPVLALVFGR
jgi:hypothetical protein